MPTDQEIAEPYIDERVLPNLHEYESVHDDGPYVAILYNDDHHDVMEVASQIQKATGYNFERCILIMLTAHNSGRAIVYTGSEEECE